MGGFTCYCAAWTVLYESAPPVTYASVANNEQNEKEASSKSRDEEMFGLFFGRVSRSSDRPEQFLVRE